MNDNSFIKEKLNELLIIVGELEEKFPGRHFSLDGHLLGSIGEVFAKDYYNITLYPNNTKTHDGEIDNKKVQIKITQGESVDINEMPDDLLVLFLNIEEREVYEVYNGPCDWLKDCKRTKNGWYNRSLKKMLELDTSIRDEERICSVKSIKKWNCTMKNK